MSLQKRSTYTKHLISVGGLTIRVAIDLDFFFDFVQINCHNLERTDGNVLLYFLAYK